MKKNISISKFIVTPNTNIKLSKWDTGFSDDYYKNDAENLLKNEYANQMSNLQYKLFADKKQSLLIILQGMDASGKDSTIRHVMSFFNPQSCNVVSFKKPSDEETSHDYLWRVHKYMPAKGEITIFNRSYYEEVLTVKVNKIITEEVCTKRYNQINNFEKYLFENDIKIIKLFLHISKEEQKIRLEKRINDPAKQWKFSESDIIERKLWKEYVGAYEEMLSKCSTKNIPWYIIPTDNKWFRNFIVAQIIINALDNMKLEFPKAKIDLSKALLYE
ncbi:MAG TPA: polyphosphate kinase 2 family protein [Verrucomicrobiae bacterium]|nr:polyphosphate kinase 2 family protein [Verrucomicrobiae bacterium]